MTEEAKKLEPEYNAVTEEIRGIYYKGFTESEIEQLECYLRRVLENVEGSAWVSLCSQGPIQNMDLMAGCPCCHAGNNPDADT